MTLDELEPNLHDFQTFVSGSREATDGWPAGMLLSWLDERRPIVDELRQLGQPESRLVRLADDTAVLHGLYALSRLVDLLIAPYQRENPAAAADRWWPGPLPSRDAWPAFLDAMGTTRITEDTFHPFFHEIADVEATDDPDQPPELLAEVWPGAIAGSLLVTRAGVRVRAGRNHLDPAVSAKSCLYWTWFRRNRRTSDLSHGWGGSSQWGTDFRRDYITPEAFHYNVDESYQDHFRYLDATDELSAEDRRDLLRYRHSIRQDLGDQQLPFGYSGIEPRT